MSKDTSMRIKKEVKERLLNLDFVKRQSESDLILYLIDFYEKNSPFRKSVNGKKRGRYGKNK